MSSTSLVIAGRDFQQAYLPDSTSKKTTKQHTKSQLSAVFHSEKISDSTLGEIFVKSAPRIGDGRLKVLLNSTGFKRIPQAYLDEGVLAAAKAGSFTTVEKILNFKRSHEISPIALSCLLEVCAARFRSSESRSLINRIFELPNSKDIEAPALAMLFEACVGDADIQHSTKILEKVFKRKNAKDITTEKVQTVFTGVLGVKGFIPNVVKMVGQMICSPIANKISDDDLGVLYEKGVAAGNNELAEMLRAYAETKGYSGDSEVDEFYFYVLFNKAEEVEYFLAHRLTKFTPDEIAKAFYKVCCAVSNPTSQKILSLLIEALKGHASGLSKLARLYLTEAFWRAAVTNNEPLKTVYLKSFVAELIDPSDLNKLEKVCSQRHQKARQELEVEVGLNLCGGPTLWLYSPV